MISTLWKTCAVCAIFTLLTSLRIQPRRGPLGRAAYGREISSARGFPDERGFSTEWVAMLCGPLTTENSNE